VSTIIDQFKTAMLAAGLTPPDEIIDDGMIHRFSTNGKPRDESGWYVLHSDGVAAGSFGDWREGFTQTWCSKSDTTMTEAERQANRERVQAMQRQREADLLIRQTQAAHDADKRVKAAKPCTQHPYLDRKGIKPHGVKIEGDNLLIPVRNTDGTVHSLQTIAADGTKMFMPGGRVKACYFSIGKPNGSVIVCEGFATGASIHEATGGAVAIAFNAGNLLDVATALRSKYPDLKIILAADDDHLTVGNPGLTKARAAAQAVGGYLATPEFFGYDRPDGATDFNDLHQLAGLAAVKAGIENAIQIIAGDASYKGATGLNDVWPAPIEIVSDLPLAPEFEANVLLPKQLADFVMDEADRMPCSPDYIAAAVIVCLGSVIGASCALKPKRRDDWIVVPNVWGGIVGDPSSKKSPGLGVVTRFIDRLEAREADKLVEAKKIFEAEQAAYEANQSAVKANMKKAATGKPDPLKMAAAIDDLKAIAPPDEPHARRYKSNDASVEKLCDIEARNPQGLMVFRDELVGLLASWEREGHEGDRAYYLEGWNGSGSYNSDRIGRGEQFVKNHCLSILGGIQPDKMETYLADIASNLDNDGRVQRFQVMVYPNPVPWQWRDRYPVKGAREAVRDMFDRLSVFDPVLDGAAPADDFVKLPHFYFDDAAQEIFIEWCSDLNLVQIAREQDPLMKQHLGKFEKLFCSLALILHLAEGNIGHVKAESALRAAAWCDYLAGHARRIYGMVEGAKVCTAKMLLRRIQDGKLQSGFTLRTVRQKNWSGAANNIQIEAALAMLEAHHCVRGFESASGGRPTTT
jgi:putative DNA primase/helicase